MEYRDTMKQKRKITGDLCDAVQITRSGISRHCHCMCDERGTRLSGLNCSEVSLTPAPIPYGACVTLFGREPTTNPYPMDTTAQASPATSRPPSAPASPSLSQRPSTQGLFQLPQSLTTTSSPFITFDPSRPDYMTRVCLEAYSLCLRRMGLPTDPLALLEHVNSLDD